MPPSERHLPRGLDRLRQGQVGQHELAEHPRARRELLAERRHVQLGGRRRRVQGSTLHARQCIATGDEQFILFFTAKFFSKGFRQVLFFLIIVHFFRFSKFGLLSILGVFRLPDAANVRALYRLVRIRQRRVQQRRGPEV